MHPASVHTYVNLLPRG